MSSCCILRFRWLCPSLVALLLAATGGCHQSPAPAAIVPRSTATINGDLGQRLDQLFSALAPELFSGTVLIARDGIVLLHQGYGLAHRVPDRAVTPTTVFPVASLSKQFTAAAILKLVAQGRLTLADSVGQFFPDAPAEKRAITIHQLLTGTAGLPRDATPGNAVIGRDSVVLAILRVPLSRPPGTTHEYSNAGYLLLAALVERVSGMPFDAFLAQELFAPAGLASTGFPTGNWSGRTVAHGFGREEYRGTPLDEPAAIHGWYRRGAGGLLSTTDDLYRWERALTSGAVLPDSLVRLLFTSHVPEEPGGNSYYGYGWVLSETSRGTPVIWHDGGWGPYYAQLRRYPAEEIVAIALTNERGAAFEAAWEMALRLVFATR